MWYAFNGTLWEPDHEGIQVRHELSTTIREYFYGALNHYLQNNPAFAPEDDKRSSSGSSSAHSNADKSQEMLKFINEMATRLQDRRFKDNVMAELREYMMDYTFESKLDSKIHLIAFTNGVWDLVQGCFRPAGSDDYLSISTGLTTVD